mmetsp:Transcript_26796/g.62748  ORF Transcript_26796/g.62748 Transcript_26796/m.62748 type:complete len:266 (-) Transcript_26796:235-1032(-)
MSCFVDEEVDRHQRHQAIVLVVSHGAHFDSAGVFVQPWSRHQAASGALGTILAALAPALIRDLRTARLRGLAGQVRAAVLHVQGHHLQLLQRLLHGKKPLHPHGLAVEGFGLMNFGGEEIGLICQHTWLAQPVFPEILWHAGGDVAGLPASHSSFLLHSDASHDFLVAQEVIPHRQPGTVPGLVREETVGQVQTVWQAAGEVPTQMGRHRIGLIQAFRPSPGVLHQQWEEAQSKPRPEVGQGIHVVHILVAEIPRPSKGGTFLYS